MCSFFVKTKTNVCEAAPVAGLACANHPGPSPLLPSRHRAVFSDYASTPYSVSKGLMACGKGFGCDCSMLIARPAEIRKAQPGRAESERRPTARALVRIGLCQAVFQFGRYPDQNLTRMDDHARLRR